jgi:hypothetical protein
MKTFLLILLHLVCSECQIESGGVEKIPYTTLDKGQLENIIDYTPITIYDFKDYSNFYFNYYGSYPDTLDFDFSKNMMVVIFTPYHGYDIQLNNVYETNDQIAIDVYNPPVSKAFSLCGPPMVTGTTEVINPKASFLIINLKRSDKGIQVYN